MSADNLRFQQTVGAMLSKLRSPQKTIFKPKGRFRVEHTDKDGKLKGIYEFNNDIVNVGKNDILGVYFSGASQTGSSSWVIGLISNSGYSALAAGDTMASHAGWTEFTSYSQSTRVAWGPGSASSQSVTNASPATFDISGSGTVKGIFVVNQNTKGGTTGTLWATALFSADVPVTNGDQLKVTYTVNA
jgi:hypothetical protein